MLIPSFCFSGSEGDSSLELDDDDSSSDVLEKIKQLVIQMFNLSS